MSDTELHVPDTMHIGSEEPEGERKLTPREEAMARIARHAEEERGKEIAQGSIYDAEARQRGEALPPATFEEDEPEEELEEHAEAAPLSAPEPAPLPTPVAPPAPQLRTLNLNGQTITVTDEQLTQLAQMGALAGMALSQPPAPPPVHEQPRAPEPAFDDAKVRETVQRIQFGSPDEGTAALGGLIRDLMAKVPAAPAVDQNALVNQATQRALQELHGQQVTTTIRSEFPQIFSDPGLMALAHQRVNQIVQRDVALGQRRPEIDIYREAGNLVYDQMHLPRPGSDTTQTAPQAASVSVQPRADVVERKRAAPRNPQPIDRRSAMPAQQPQGKSNSEIIAWMRQKRYQEAMQ